MDLTIPQRVELWRAKQREGTLTLEEAKEAIAHLRGDRKTAMTEGKSSSTGRKKIAAPVIDVDDLI
jgi:hypothetical protein